MGEYIIMVVIVMVNILMVVLIFSIWENVHLTSDEKLDDDWMINDCNDNLMMLVMTVKTIAETEQDHNVLKIAIDQRW